MDEVESAERRALLARGRDAVLQRLHCYNEASLPQSCTPQLAWSTLRKSMAEETYYFSVEELRLLFAAQGVLLDFLLLWHRAQEGMH